MGECLLCRAVLESWTSARVFAETFTLAVVRCEIKGAKQVDLIDMERAADFCAAHMLATRTALRESVGAG